ncbi:gephyrin-like molybdotransferase Glp [Corynebacterium alimapuense]|uniref:Molybdopterin molybdenumtransferase n=1 Tax=Corynebacterium alimapuense TaxID=1576874 RepID=A0A3M8K7E7_9CORY|nr:gephyrin-like molybdotransferase Glp [Corynebacterium alimapuense]RNE48408.1 molybdopterin molybdenumtransferase MoeA [Corynebacterium alimapuense]
MSPRSVSDHLAAVVEHALPRSPISLDLSKAHGLVLASDAQASLPVPPFSNSAMDGFLVHTAELVGAGPWSFPVIGDVPAGASPIELPDNAAVRIMTGAPVPEPHHQLRVIPVENTNITPGPGPLPDYVTINRVPGERTHIRSAGENISPGQAVMSAGSRIDAGAVAALISAGVDQVSVYPLPRVAVISSGDELVEAGVAPGAGQLPDSNRPMIASLLAELGIKHVTQFHGDDQTGDFQALLAQVCDTHELVITTGGVSVGAFDVVRAATDGKDMWFGSVAQRPGSPQGLGTWHSTTLMCLPGNPVAAFVSFCLYGPPLLWAMSGSTPQAGLWERPYVVAQLAAGTELSGPPARTLLSPVRLNYSAAGITATPFHHRGPGSHLVASLADTDGIAVLDPGADTSAGDPDIRVLLRP